MSSRKALIGLIVLVTALFIAFQLSARRGGGDAAQTRSAARGSSAPVTPRVGSPPRGPQLGTATSLTSASGQVTGEGRGALAGAIVTLTALEGGEDEDEDEGATPIVAVADADGRWRVADALAGRYALAASAPGFLTAAARVVTLRAKAENAGLDLTLRAGGHALSGVITDMTGGVVEGAIVRLTPAEGITRLRARDSYATLSREDGRYALQAAAGRYRVSVLHEDYAAVHRTLELAGPLARDYALTPMAVIEGVVVTQRGAPVPGARVQHARERGVALPGGQRGSFTESGGAVVADGEGRFRLRGLSPGTILLYATAAGRASGTPTTVALAVAEQRAGVRVVVDDAHTLRGRVVVRGDSSRGVAGASVVAAAAGPFEPRTTTDEQGAFTLHGVLAGPVTLRASARGYLRSLGGESRTVDGDQDDIVLELDAGRFVRGRVEPPVVAEITQELSPAALGVSVAGGFGVASKALNFTRVLSDEDGAFEFGPVEAGALTLRAQAADGRAGAIDVMVREEGAEDVVIALEERARVSGVVTDARGQPVADALVSLKPAQAPGVRATLVINGRDMGARSVPVAEDGSFELAGLEAGDYELAALELGGGPLAWASPEDPARPTKPRALTLADGERRRGLSLVVEARDGVIEGVVRTGDGEPAPDVWVTATLAPPSLDVHEPDEGVQSSSSMVMMISTGAGAGGSRELPPALTDDDGRFAFTGLRDGEYSVRAEGGGERSTAEGVRPGQEVALELAPLATIEGQVTMDGTPLTDPATAVVSGPSQRTARVSGGRFAAERLEPGAYTVAVSTARGSATSSVVVAGGETTSLRVDLTPFVRVRGTVVDEDGAPIAGARLMLGEGDGQSVSITRSGAHEDPVTDEDGRFELSAGSGPRVLMILRPDVPAPLAIRPFVVEGGRDVELGEIRADPKLAGATVQTGPSEPAPGGVG